MRWSLDNEGVEGLSLVLVLWSSGGGDWGLPGACITSTNSRGVCIISTGIAYALACLSTGAGGAWSLSLIITGATAASKVGAGWRPHPIFTNGLFEAFLHMVGRVVALASVAHTISLI